MSLQRPFRFTRSWGVAAVAAGALVGSLMAVPATAATVSHGQGNLAHTVDTLIGTAAGGNTFPGATMPFGMTQPSPDTPSHPSGGGYSYGDSKIVGFSTAHISGPGCGALGHVSVMPVTGEVTSTDPTTYASTFSHATEQASAGAYAVTLQRYGVRAELTATTRTAWERYTFPQGATDTLLVNLGAAQNATSAAHIDVVGNDTIEGYQSTGAFCGGNRPVTVHFVAKFSRPFTASGTWDAGRVSWGTNSADGRAIGAALTFSPAHAGGVVAKIGVSYVDLAGARANLAAEAQGFHFDAVRAQAAAAWNHWLHRAVITGGTDAQRTNYYTALYHSLIQPNVFSDVDGRYVGMDGKVHVAIGRVEYTNLSLWDTYRTQQQLLGLIARPQARDVMLSMVHDTEELGWVPRWVLANVETNVMSGDPGTPMFADALATGLLTPAEVAPIYPILHANATQPAPSGNAAVGRVGVDFYRQHGYVAYDTSVYMQRSAASATLEWALADCGMAHIAKAVGEAADAADFAQFAHSYRNEFDPSTGFFRPRYADGSWMTPFDPAHETAPWQDGKGYDEGSAWQYLWLTAQDAPDLAHLIGGTDKTIAQLDQFFSYDTVAADPSTARGAWSGGAHYSPYNEVDLQAPYTYDALGTAWKTQVVVRADLTQIYRPTPDGIPGNDDLGTMSAWYVLSALGLYPYAPGQGAFALSTPLFDRAVLTPAGSDAAKIVISAPGATDATYVAGLQVNGHDQQAAWLPYSTLREGARLTYQVSSRPNTSWGAGAANSIPAYCP